MNDREISLALAKEIKKLECEDRNKDLLILKKYFESRVNAHQALIEKNNADGELVLRAIARGSKSEAEVALDLVNDMIADREGVAA